jgi:hypothetical protein
MTEDEERRYPELSELRRELYERPRTKAARIRRFFSQVEVGPIETILFFMSLYWGASLTGDDPIFELLPGFRYFQHLPLSEDQQGWAIVALALFTLFATAHKERIILRLVALMSQVFLWGFIGSTIFRAIHFAPPIGMYFCMFCLAVYAFVRLSFDAVDAKNARKAFKRVYLLRDLPDD